MHIPLLQHREYITKTFEGDIPALFKEKVSQINKTVSPAKAIRRLRVRDTEFEKTTSKKIKRQQSGEPGKEI